jgi:hypothetical protein
VLVKVRNTGAYISVKLFEYVIILVGQVRQEIFPASDKLKMLHVEHNDHCNE